MYDEANLQKLWHPTLNETKTIVEFLRTHRRKDNAYWLCPNGKLAEHVYSKNLVEMRFVVSMNRTGCPFCSGKKPCADNCLKTIDPETAKEWDFEANTPETPETVLGGSDKKFGWICNICTNKWNAVVKNRVSNKTGCPKCYRQTSQSEIFVFSQVLWCFPQAENGVAIEGFKLDILVREFNFAIEVDGWPWHLNKCEFDSKKTEFLKKAGVKVFRFRDKRLGLLGSECVLTDLQNSKKIDFSDLKELFRLIEREVCLTPEHSTRISEYLGLGSIPNLAAYSELRNQYRMRRPINNLHDTHPDIASEWNVESNGNLKPENVTAKSNRRIAWKCKSCSTEWRAIIWDRTYGSAPCPNCSPLSRARKDVNLRNKQLLEELYIKQQKTAAEIAGILGRGNNTVSRWLMRHGIQPRTRSETSRIRDANMKLLKRGKYADG